MVIDTSAMVAILQGEPVARDFVYAISADEERYMSVASWLECSIVLSARFGSEGLRDFDHFVAKARIELVPVDEEQAQLARVAHRRFGKGQHAAGLNFGDCFAYALAVATDERLLFTGDDFSLTDVLCHEASGPRDAQLST